MGSRAGVENPTEIGEAVPTFYNALVDGAGYAVDMVRSFTIDAGHVAHVLGFCWSLQKSESAGGAFFPAAYKTLEQGFFGY